MHLTRREWMAALAAAGSASAAPPAGPGRPDVLFILTDQWNPRCLGYAGDTAVRTPNLDRLAAEGTVFDNCYTPSPICMPARASLLSGRNLNYMVRTPDHVWWIHRGKEALYDMRNDPFQLTNLIASASHRGVLDAMRMRHLEFFKTTQINLSDTYRPMLDRLTEEGGGKQGLTERLYQQYRRKQKLGEK